MTNDTSTLNGALAELGETMADNLVSMGVTGASANDGLTTLASKILNIAPSVGGITPTVSIDISKTPETVSAGNNVLISAKVNADYDDESLTNVDLKGVLQGATVTFKNNGTTMGTGITGSDGIATYTLSNVVGGTSYSITAHFDGTGTDYESATSSALTFTVQSFGFEDTFTGSTLDSNWIKFGANCTTTVSNGALTMTKSSSGVGGIYYNKQITGDYKITLEVASSTYNCYCFGIIRNGNNNGYNFYQAQPNYSFEYMNLTDTGSESSVKNYGSMSISHNNSTIVMEVIKDTSVKIYKNGTLQKTYTLTNGTTDGYVGFKQCCNRSAVINSIKVEAL